MGTVNPQLQNVKYMPVLALHRLEIYDGLIFSCMQGDLLVTTPVRPSRSTLYLLDKRQKTSDGVYLLTALVTAP